MPQRPGDHWVRSQVCPVSCWIRFPTSDRENKSGLLQICPTFSSPLVVYEGQSCEDVRFLGECSREEGISAESVLGLSSKILMGVLTPQPMSVIITTQGGETISLILRQSWKSTMPGSFDLLDRVGGNPGKGSVCPSMWECWCKQKSPLWIKANIFTWCKKINKKNNALCTSIPAFKTKAYWIGMTLTMKSHKVIESHRLRS